MEVIEAPFVQGFIRMASDAWDQGWHERNGGNLSYRAKPEEMEPILDSLSPQEWLPLGISAPGVGGEHFLITAAGSFFRNITLDPERCMGLIELDEAGELYRICWGFSEGGRPTSELPTHIMNQEAKAEATDGRNRVIYHAHPANTVALTFVLPQDSAIFTCELWEMISECAMVFPQGVGVVPWMVPGGREIALASCELMRVHDAVIWAHHGMFCAGETFDLAFGLMHTIEKAAEVLVKVRSMQPEKTARITARDLDDLAEAYGLELNSCAMSLKRTRDAGLS